MSLRYVITGTGTDIGKTVFSAALMLGLDSGGLRPSYWKPVQSGVAGGVDTKLVQELTGLHDERFLPERYILSEPLSPHRAAEIDGVSIDIDALEPPVTSGPLLIEGAGGLMVPLTRTTLMIDLFEIWNIPLILCARTDLGTINHTLLSLEAIKRRAIPLYGIAFIGEENADNMRTIGEFSGAPVLGRLPRLDVLNAESLLRAFEEHFSLPVIPSAGQGP